MGSGGGGEGLFEILVEELVCVVMKSFVVWEIFEQYEGFMKDLWYIVNVKFFIFY